MTTRVCEGTSRTWDDGLRIGRREAVSLPIQE